MLKLNPWYKSPLFFFHILTHLSIIPMILYSTWYQWLIAIVMYHLYGCLGVAITYHRLISHKAFEAPKWFRNIGLVFGSLAGVGSSVEWTAVHRDHHRHTDTDKDPHNPSGGWKRFLQMQFLTMLVPSSPRYVPDLLRDPLHQKFHKYYWHLHLIYIVILLFLDPFAIIYAYLFPCVMFWHVMSSLGTFAHTEKFGKTNYITKDKSRNIWFLGYFGFGEGWHNNHHYQASDWRFGKEKFEFDLSAKIIDMVRAK